MNGKRDVPPENKQKKVDRMKCHLKQEQRGKIKQCHEKSSYSYSIIGHSLQHVFTWLKDYVNPKTPIHTFITNLTIYYKC